MPTGYTYPVRDKEDLSFEEFVWGCAKAFGALMHMRDDDYGAEIKLPKESDYHKNALKEAQANLERLQKMTLAEAKVERDREYAETRQRAQESLAEKLAARKRYERMIKLVKDWNPPTSEHNGLKEFMLSQLNQSLDFDCNDDYYERILAEPVKPVKKWLTIAIESAEYDVNYHIKEAQKEHEGTLKSIEWIMQLQHSVPLPKDKDKI